MNRGDIHFSCGFFQHSLNFHVWGLKSSSNTSSPLYDSLRNFLERGYPTRPTHYLESKIKELDPDFSWNKNTAPLSAMVRPHNPNWNDTIKGFDQGSRFPAQTFFNNSIDEHISEYSFIKNLIVPECTLGDILVDPIKAGGRPEWAVDFFLPCADLVIEVDGPQHQGEPEKSSDSTRDRILRKYGIKTHRVETHKINDNGNGIRNYFTALKKILDENEEIQRIKTFIQDKKFNEITINYDLIALARLQRVVVELLDAKQIKNGDRLEIKADFQPLLNWPQLALEDLKNTYDLLRFHFAKSPKFPDFQCSLVDEFSTSDAAVKIDLSLFRHADDTRQSDNAVCIRNSQLREVYLWNTKEPITRPKVHVSNLSFDEPTIKQKRGLKQNLEKLNAVIFGLDEFRTGQFEIISSTVESGSILGLLPTGGGKSLCFQSPGAVDFGCTIIVCPITALIRDHVLELKQFGFDYRADFISAEVKPNERAFIFEKLRAGSLKFLFLSPEQFQKREFRLLLEELYQKDIISRFVIDEVHCISEWGHDFRTAYLNLAYTIRKFAPKVPVLCLTATAAVKVIKDIQIEFNMSDEDIIYSMGQSRHELEFQVKSTQKKLEGLQILLKQRYENKNISKENALIVFSPTINDNQKQLGVFGISQNIRNLIEGTKIGIYSGGTPKEFVLKNELKNISATSETISSYEDYKIEVQKQFKRNELDGIVATKSFGMGVNKPNVRLVVHYGMPQSLEALYQEAGRAGRDKNASECITLFTPEARTPEAIHSANTSLEDLKSLQKGMERNGGDLSQQLWFLTKNNQLIDEELQECCRELQFLRRFGSDGFVTLNDSEADDSSSNKRTKEKIIYRLKQLGFIKDWTVEDFIKGIYLVEWADQNSDTLGNSISKIIRKYSEADASVERYDNKISDAKLQQEAEEKELIKILLEWNYEHFVYQRRQSLKHIYDACSSFKNSKEFKEIVESYFQTNKAFSQLPTIISLSAKDVLAPIKEIILTKDGRLKSENKLRQMSNNLMKYLEGYRDNPGLNILSALLRLAYNDFENPDGRPRFEQFLETFEKDSASVSLLEPLIDLLCKFEPNLGRQAFTCIFDRFREPVLAKMVLQRVECEEAEYILIDDLNARLEKVI